MSKTFDILWYSPEHLLDFRSFFAVRVHKSMYAVMSAAGLVSNPYAVHLLETAVKANTTLLELDLRSVKGTGKTHYFYSPHRQIHPRIIV